jgi:aspartate/methionine/tyrosine aminotransferase
MTRGEVFWQNRVMSALRSPPFTRRTTWERRPNALTEAWQRRLRSGLAADDLTESNPTVCGFVYPEERIRSALADARGLRYDPRPFGLPAARAAVADRLRIDPARVVLTASTSEAYAWLMKLLCERGDRLLTPRPSYPLFDFLAGLEEVELERYPLHYDGRWRVDLEDLTAHLGDRTRAVAVVHPNNPTGSALTAGEAAALRRICAERGVALISDEVFLEYVERKDATADPDRPAGSLAGDAPCLTFSLGGLSKAAGLPQIKVGWIAVGGPAPLVDEALARLEIVADTYLSVNTPAQWALPELLNAGEVVREQIRRRAGANRRWLAARSHGAAWQLYEADGGWTAVLRVPRVRSEEDWCTFLAEEEGVLLHPGFFFEFDAEAILVCSLLPPEARFRDAMERALRHFA